MSGLFPRLTQLVQLQAKLEEARSARTEMIEDPFVGKTAALATLDAKIQRLTEQRTQLFGPHGDELAAEFIAMSEVAANQAKKVQQRDAELERRSQVADKVVQSQSLRIEDDAVAIAYLKQHVPDAIAEAYVHFREERERQRQQEQEPGVGGPTH